MKKWVLLTLISVLAVTTPAEEKALDLTLDPSTFYEQNPEQSGWHYDENFKTEEQQLSDHCRELNQQIKAMKGKPQRRFVLRQRYEEDCLR